VSGTIPTIGKGVEIRLIDHSHALADGQYVPPINMTLRRHTFESSSFGAFALADAAGYF